MKTMLMGGVGYLFLGFLTSIGLRGFWRDFIDPYEEVEENSMTWREVISWPYNLMVALSLVLSMILIPVLDLLEPPPKSNRRGL